MRQALVDTDTPSASVVLIDGDRIVWSETFGYIDKATLTAPSPTTMYGIGSVSKVFAAMAAMKLVDQGKIDLDAPLSYEKDAKRTVYLPVARNNPSGELALFDGANPDLVTGKRNDTTVPTQALYLLNSGFLLNEARAVAKAAIGKGGLPGSEVDRLYQTLLGRAPDPVERERALGLIADLSGGSEDKAAIEEATGHLAHLLMASTEFLYLE